MSAYPVISVVDGLPTFERQLEDILRECEVGGAIKILSPLEAHTDRQRRWYHGICLRGLANWSGDSVIHWDRKLKRDCEGLKYLKKEVLLTDDGSPVGRLTIKGVGKKNMTAFIELILEKAIEMDWPVTPPDPELRSEKL